jgi:hypothetical protein
MTDLIRTRTTTQGAPERRASTTLTHPAPSACCGGPAPAGTDACCARDADVKSTGGAGCGCGSAPAPAKSGCCG